MYCASKKGQSKKERPEKGISLKFALCAPAKRKSASSWLKNIAEY